MGNTRSAPNNKLFASATRSKGDTLYRLNVGERAFLKSLWSCLAGDSKKGAPLVWQNGKSELLVHHSTLKLSVKPGLIIVGLSFEADQIPKSELVFVYRISESHKTLVLQAVTEALPRGNKLLAASWGEIAQQQIWAALLLAAEREQAKLMPKEPLELAGIYADELALRFVFTQPVEEKIIRGVLDKVVEKPQSIKELKAKAFSSMSAKTVFVDIGAKVKDSSDSTDKPDVKPKQEIKPKRKIKKKPKKNPFIKVKPKTKPTIKAKLKAKPTIKATTKPTKKTTEKPVKKPVKKTVKSTKSSKPSIAPVTKPTTKKTLKSEKLKAAKPRKSSLKVAKANIKTQKFTVKTRGAVKPTKFKPK